jgi:hypothetical protein
MKVTVKVDIIWNFKCFATLALFLVSNLIVFSKRIKLFVVGRLY